MRILYLHGLYSKPGGTKPTFLQGRGYEVLNPALGDEDFAESVRIAQEAFDAGRPRVVVGSSRGGAVAMNIDSGTVPLVLVAPAWNRWGTATTVKHQTIVLHSERDDVVPFADSRALVEVSGLDPSALVVVGADHNMVDDAALEALVAAIKRAGQGA
ncbi:MAG TPA: hypothetical protein VGY53_05535 [Isosphaeraceae bacterium]|nr:hypothetical protein [Isosphaeraceae bacterium]